MKQKVNKLILVILLFSLGACAHYLNPQKGHRVPAAIAPTISPEEIERIYQRLPWLGEDKVAYHWTSIGNAFRWGLNRTIDRGEVEFLNLPSRSGGNQKFGPGFYISLDPENSKSYGELVMNIKLPKWLRVYNELTVNEILGRTLQPEEHLALKTQLNVIGIADTSRSWYIINNPNLLRNVELQEDVALKRLHLSKLYYSWKKLPEGLLKDGQETDLGRYIQSLFTLIYYQDALAFERSFRVSPGNPWQEFEPDRFEAYKNKLKMVSNNSTGLGERPEKDALKLCKDTFIIGSEYFSKKDWAKLQRDQILPSLNPVASTYRNEGVRAGGPGPMQTLRATSIELFNLLANEYIEVHYTTLPGTEDFNVHYFYPDAFHFKHLKSYLSKELYEELLNENPTLLLDNHAKRQSLNQKIIKELLTITLEKYEGQNIKTYGLSLYKELMSIHPFADGNGRTLRLYFMAMNANANAGLPLMFWSDDDLMKGTTRLSTELEKTSAAVNDFMVNYVLAALKKSPEMSMEEFNRSMGTTGFLETLWSEGALDSRDLTQAEEKLIKERKIVEFKDSYTQGRWRKISITSDIKDIFVSGVNTEAKQRAFIFCLQNKQLTESLLDIFDIFELGINEVEIIRKLPSEVVLPRLLKILKKSNKSISESMSQLALYYLNEERVKITDPDFMSLAREVITGKYYSLEAKKVIVHQLIKLGPSDELMKFVGKELVLGPENLELLDPLVKILYPKLNSLNNYRSPEVYLYRQLIERAYMASMQNQPNCQSAVQGFIQN